MRYGTGCLNLCMLIQYIKLSEAIVHMLHCTSSFFQFQFSFAGRQGSSQSDPCTITGFGSFNPLNTKLYSLKVLFRLLPPSFTCISTSARS